MFLSFVLSYLANWRDNLVADFGKNYMGSYNNGVSLIGAAYYKNDIGTLYTVDVEGGIPMLMGTQGELDGSE